MPAISEFASWMEESTQKAFRKLGLAIGYCPWTCIIISVMAALVLATGVVNFKEVNNVRDHFSADNSPSRYEFAVAREFFKELGSPFHVVVAMEAADGGSLLRPKYIDRALEIEEYLQYKLKVMHNNRQYSYSDFCGAQCETRWPVCDAVNIFLAMFRDVQYRKRVAHRIYLANNIFKVQQNNRSKLVEGANLITINFHAIYPNASMEELMKKWEHAVLEYSLNSFNNSLIRLYTTSEGLVSEEVRRTGIKALPLMSVTFIVIVVFTVLTSLKRDMVTSRQALGGFCWSSLSDPLPLCLFWFAFWLGFEFLPIVVVVPFLILAIGVDDVFIFLHCWARSDPKLPLRERVGEMLADAGPSITITSLTNWLSFAIGIFTPTPAIRTFCIFISVAVFFDYLYQLFFYTAVIMIGGRREELRLNAYVPFMKVAESSSTIKTQETSALRERMRQIGAKISRGVSKFVDIWVDFCMSITARVFLAVVLLCYWTFAAYGVAQKNFSWMIRPCWNLVCATIVRLQTNVIFKEGGQMAVFVNNPGDLKHPDAIPDLMKILDRFERATGSVGSSSTQMWLNPYLPFVGLQNRGSIDFKYKYLPEFFSNTEFHRWSHFVSLGPAQDCYSEKSSCVNKFFFSTGFRNAVAWTDRLTLLQTWRSIASDYQHLNLTVYEDFSMYSDQLLTIPPVTIQTVGFALLCMAIVLVIFTPNYSTILPGVASVLSINLGVFGLLFYWDIDLDPISMTTTLMAIGLSVDFVAHISFHYYKGDIEDRKERLRHALVSIAWPMMQAALSTVLSLLILATIHAYMVQVFVKVVTIVVSLGLIHGLIVLPIVYAAIPFAKNKPYADRAKRRLSQIAPTKIAIGGDNSPDLARRYSLSSGVLYKPADLNDEDKRALSPARENHNRG